MIKYIRFSYDMDIHMPLYPGTRPLQLKSEKSISRKDSCNTYRVAFSNHSGTHIDAPRHFYNSGRPIAEFRPEELIFDNPCIIDCAKKQNQPIEVKDLEPHLKPKSTILLLRTGFSKFRKKRIYCTSNPYISCITAEWLRRKLPNLRAIGIDCISVSSYANRNEGRLTHKILLRKDGYRRDPILIIEDLYLPHNIQSLSKVMVFPLYIKDVDSSPCTVVGVIDD